MPKRRVRRQALIEARVAAGLSQSEMAERLGITQEAYCRYETGSRRPSLDMAWRIAQILGRRIEDIFPEDLGLKRSA